MTPAALPDPTFQPEFYAGTTTKRLIAWVVDTLLVLVLSTVFALMTFGIGFFVFPLVFLTVSVVYRIGTMAAGSATWGMRFAGVEIRNARGARLDGGEAALHTVLYLISVAFFLPQIASWALMLFGGKGQGLHDIVMGTAAINRPQ